MLYVSQKPNIKQNPNGIKTDGELFWNIWDFPEEALEAKELGQKSPEPTTRLEGASYPPGVSSDLVVDPWTPQI